MASVQALGKMSQWGQQMAQLSQMDQSSGKGVAGQFNQGGPPQAMNADNNSTDDAAKELAQYIKGILG